MAEDNLIGLQAIFENEDFQKGISEYNSSVSDASSNTEEAGGSMSATWLNLSSVGLIAFTAIAAGVAAMAAELYVAVDAAMEAEQVMARMEFVVGNVGERTGVTAEDVNALAESLSQVVPIDDEVITQALTMGLTFDGVTKDNIEPLIRAAADLATWTGKDLPSAMKELSLAITDPERAMRLFRDANITLTEEQKNTLKALSDTGDTAGATAFILDQLAQKGIIGLGEAMGETATGKMTIMQTALGNLQEALGTGLLTSLSGVFDRITLFATDPRTTAFFAELGASIGLFAEEALARLPEIMTVIDGIAGWLEANKPVVIGVLAAIGAALTAFGITSAAAGVAAVAPFLPVIAAIAAVGLAVGLLYKAWTENWGGIQQKTAKLFAQLKPTFDKLTAWMAVNLPKAIKTLSDFFTKTLLPAVRTVFEWWVDNIFPIYAETFVWLAENLPKAIKTLSDFFTKTLLPAITVVYSFITSTLIPILKVLFEWLSGALVNAVRTLSAIWTNVLLPAITAISNFVNSYLIPAFNAIVNVISGVLTGAINTLSALWNNVLLPAMQAVYNFINAYIMPVFNAVSNLMSAVVGLAVRVLAGVWQNVLLPALTAVYSYVNNVIAVFNSVANVMGGVLGGALNTLTSLWRNTLLPALTTVYNFINNNILSVLSDLGAKISGYLMGAIRPFATFLENTLYNALDGIRDIIGWVVARIDELTDALNNLTLPDWLTPGSPTPLELGLVGINNQLDKLAGRALPAVKMQMDVLGSVRDVPSSPGQPSGNSVSNTSQRTSNYMYGTQFNIPSTSGFIEALQTL